MTRLPDSTRVPCVGDDKARSVTIAAIALATVDGQLASNYLRAMAMTCIAAASRPAIVLLPEAFAAGYCCENLAPYTELRHSPHQQMMAALSRELDCMIVYGWLEAQDKHIRNVATIVDRGHVLRVHAKSSLWPDDDRPWRDERALMQPGDGVAVIPTRFGQVAAMVCYENMLPANWDSLAGRVDLVLSLYNCEDDPVRHNRDAATRLGIPSA
jgi:predicted amidohydrolase